MRSFLLHSWKLLTQASDGSKIWYAVKPRGPLPDRLMKRGNIAQAFRNTRYIFYQLISWALIALCVWMIHGFSAQDAKMSDALSLEVTDVVARAMKTGGHDQAKRRILPAAPRLCPQGRPRAGVRAARAGGHDGAGTRPDAHLPQGAAGARAVRRVRVV